MELLKQCTILYAEDESIIRMNLTKQLSQYFKTVYAVKNGEEALEMYKKVSPDVLMLDINMPQLSGLEVAHAVRETNKDIPIVILTAYTESPLLLDAVELNLSKYLVKPISKTKLKEALLKVEESLRLLALDVMKLSNTCFWHKSEKKLYQNKIPIELNSREQTLLDLMIHNYRKNTSIEEIMAIVWEDKYMEDISIDSVKKLVSNLRKKLPEKCLKSVYGLGYTLG